MTDGVVCYDRYLKGDGSALESLVRIYGDALIRFSYSFLRDESAAEDVMDETFITLLVKRRHFREEKSLKAFLFKVARNKCLDYLRRDRRLTPLDEGAVGKLMGDAEEEAILSERNQRFYLALQELPPNYREALELFYLEGFSVEEIAAILRKNRKQVYNFLQRAKERLRKILKKEGFEYE